MTLKEERAAYGSCIIILLLLFAAAFHAWNTAEWQLAKARAELSVVKGEQEGYKNACLWKFEQEALVMMAKLANPVQPKGNRKLTQ